MNELILEQAKRIGRKWAFISTGCGLLTAFLIWGAIAGFSNAIEMLFNKYFSIGVLSVFIYSYVVGGIAFRHVLNNKKYFIGKWMLYGLLAAYSSFLIPMVILSVNDFLSIDGLFSGIGFFMLWFTVYGAIPIVIFGSLLGSLLKLELEKLITKKEPKI